MPGSAISAPAASSAQAQVSDETQSAGVSGQLAQANVKLEKISNAQRETTPDAQQPKSSVVNQTPDQDVWNNRQGRAGEVLAGAQQLQYGTGASSGRFGTPSSMASGAVPSQGGRPQEAINEARCLISDLVSDCSIVPLQHDG